MIVVLLVLAIGALWLWGINDPFVGLYNANNNFLTLAAKNYLRFGFGQLKFFPTYFSGKLLPPAPDYYLHHPILMFLLATIGFRMFGFGNWVVHIVPLLAMVGALGMIYAIGRAVWDRRTGILAVFLAALFPMTSFFWKFMFFEQLSLFLTLVVFWFALQYLRDRSKRNFAYIFLSALLAISVDWYGGYLLFVFGFLLFSPYRKRVVSILRAYLPAILLGITAFVVAVFFLKGNIADLREAIVRRAVDRELFGLSFWPLRLALVTLVRIPLYFTPFALVSLFQLKHKQKHSTGKSLQWYVLMSAFILGILNIIALPAATWGHSYFLFYAIPFFAWSGASILSKYRMRLLVLVMALLVLWSAGVNTLKMMQVRKQYWKYDVAKQVNKALTPHETIGVVNFAGDLFENYFFHPTRAIATRDLVGWAQGNTEDELLFVVFACEGACTEAENQLIEEVRRYSIAMPYSADGNTAWLLEKGAGSVVPAAPEKFSTTPIQANGRGESIILNLYRMLRDFLNVGQI